MVKWERDTRATLAEHGFTHAHINAAIPRLAFGGLVVAVLIYSMIAFWIGGVMWATGNPVWRFATFVVDGICGWRIVWNVRHYLAWRADREQG